MKKKIIIVSLLIMIFLINICSVSNAADASPLIEDILDSSYKYYVVLKSPDGEYFCITSKVSTDVWGTDSFVLDGFTNNNTRFYKWNGVSWIRFEPTYPEGQGKIINEMPGVKWFQYMSDKRKLDVTWGNGTTSNLLYSNFDMHWFDREGEPLFFQQLPLQGSLRTRTIPVALETVKLEGVMTEIVKILGTILVVVVSFLGLHKALRMLSRLLHQS